MNQEKRERGEGRGKEGDSEAEDQAEWRKPDTRIPDSSFSVAAHTQATDQPCQLHPKNKARVQPVRSLHRHGQTINTPQSRDAPAFTLKYDIFSSWPAEYLIYTCPTLGTTF